MATVVITRNEAIEQAIAERCGTCPLNSWCAASGSRLSQTRRGPRPRTRPASPSRTRCGRSSAAETLRAARLSLAAAPGPARPKRSCGSPGCWTSSAGERVDLFDHNRGPFRKSSSKYAPEADVEVRRNRYWLTRGCLEYETLIALSQLKLHATATVTLSLKNIAMSFPAADYYGHPRRREVHEHHFFDDMHSFIAAMARRFPIDLAITVGHPAMIGTGPLGGHAVETGMVIASTDRWRPTSVRSLLGFRPKPSAIYGRRAARTGRNRHQKMKFPACR